MKRLPPRNRDSAVTVRTGRRAAVPSYRDADRRTQRAHRQLDDGRVGARVAAGILEFAGAGLLLIPRLASYSAMMLAVIMVGALEAVLTTETALGWFDPILHLFFLAIIGTAHWKRRARPQLRREVRAR